MLRIPEDAWWEDEVTFMMAKCPAMPAHLLQSPWEPQVLSSSSTPFVSNLFEDVMLEAAFREPRPHGPHERCC